MGGDKRLKTSTMQINDLYRANDFGPMLKIILDSPTLIGALKIIMNDLNQKDKEGKCLIHHAIELDAKQALKALKLLHKNGANLDISSEKGNVLHLISSMRGDNIGLFKWVQERSEGRQDLVYENHQDKRTLLEYAINSNNTKIAKHLLTCGSSTTHVNNNGEIALFHAILCNNIELCKLLLSTDKTWVIHKNRAIDLAKDSQCSPAIFKLLLNHSGPNTIKCKHFYSPLIDGCLSLNRAMKNNAREKLNACIDYELIYNNRNQQKILANIDDSLRIANTIFIYDAKSKILEKCYEQIYKDDQVILTVLLFCLMTFSLASSISILSCKIRPLATNRDILSFVKNNSTALLSISSVATLTFLISAIAVLCINVLELPKKSEAERIKDDWPLMQDSEDSKCLCSQNNYPSTKTTDSHVDCNPEIKNSIGA